MRGWGGGSSEPAIISDGATSRGYQLGAVAPGTWSVLIGKAKVPEQPAKYRVEVVLRDAPTLAPQPERVPYVPFPALRAGPDWYAGDCTCTTRRAPTRGRASLKWWRWRRGAGSTS